MSVSKLVVVVVVCSLLSVSRVRISVRSLSVNDAWCLFMLSQLTPAFQTGAPCLSLVEPSPSLPLVIIKRHNSASLRTIDVAQLSPTHHQPAHLYGSLTHLQTSICTPQYQSPPIQLMHLALFQAIPDVSSLYPGPILDHRCAVASTLDFSSAFPGLCWPFLAVNGSGVS